MLWSESGRVGKGPIDVQVLYWNILDTVTRVGARE